VREEKEKVEADSAFAKSVFAVKKSSAPLKRVVLSPEDLLAGLKSVFPTRERALNCFHLDLKSLEALSAVARDAAMLAGESVGAKDIVGERRRPQETLAPTTGSVAGLSGGIKPHNGMKQDEINLQGRDQVTDLTGDGDDFITPGPGGEISEGSELTESFKQEMLEQFTLVTEFSRHFYSMLNNERSPPLPETPASEKVIKIVGRLKEYGAGLSRKKNDLLVQLRSGGECYIS
jgi:hypothetical protein